MFMMHILLAAGVMLLTVGSFANQFAAQTQNGEAARLATPLFHHVHQNSTDPAAAIAEFQRIYPSLVKVTLGGFEGVQIPGVMSILFTRVNAPAPAQPQSAFLRHVFSVPDIRALVAKLRSMKMDVRPLYTLDGVTVDVSSDTYQNGMTRAAYEEAKAKGTLAPPTRTGGYIIFRGPENVLIETTERSSLKPGESAYGLVDMWQDHSICAELWYRTHLNVPARAGRGGAPAPAYTEANCKVPKSDYSFPSVEKVGTRRQPGGGAAFGPVSLNWFVSQSETPLAPTRGQLVDHIAVSVPALDPWIAKLEAEKVAFLQRPYKFGEMRAIVIEGPSRESIEIIGKERDDCDCRPGQRVTSTQT
jgi:hypothetical protein